MALFWGCAELSCVFRVHSCGFDVHVLCAPRMRVAVRSFAVSPFERMFDHEKISLSM